MFFDCRRHWPRWQRSGRPVCSAALQSDRVKGAFGRAHNGTGVLEVLGAAAVETCRPATRPPTVKATAAGTIDHGCEGAGR